MTKPKRYSPDWLRDLRERLGGISQERLAKLVGVSRRAVAAWEGDEKNPSLPVRKLLDMLDNGTIKP
ncbi:MAG: helix-turn-helix domain-containing protein [Gemmataceae bacterium]|nr:helix-turn-helix domain-containing protein [Gemmataceae bacterium]